ncbi:MAG: S41 family peptidase [Tunicatimonas sp.]
MRTYLFSILLFVNLLACREATEEPRISAAAEDYLNEVLDIIEANSINRNTIDWSSFRSSVFAEVGAAQTLDETYEGVRQALTLLADNHSFFLKPDGTGFSGEGTVRCDAEQVPDASVPQGVGYVRIGSFSGSSQEATAFAKAIQDRVRLADDADLMGWIVDLRGNTGGNMWPMLVGVGPILGEGVVGHFVDPDGSQFAWRYQNGASSGNGFVISEVAEPYSLIEANPKVAVLLDNNVASSGEAVAIAFIGRENTRSFGEATCGLSTANARFELSNQAELYLTVSYMADRNLNTYGGQLLPDVAVSNEEIIDQAVSWISGS